MFLSGTYSCGFLLLPALLIGSATGQQPTSELPVRVTVCELISTPALFRSRLVEVNSEVVTGFEVSGIRDQSCGGQLVWLQIGDRKDERPWAWSQGEYAYTDQPEIGTIKPSLTWSTVTPLRFIETVRNAVYEQFLAAADNRHDSDRNCMEHAVYATIVRRFDYDPGKWVWVRSDPGAAPQQHGTGFGHLSMFRSRLVMESVAEVRLGPENPCWRKASRKQ
jgi:hypothetical protein